MLMQSEGRVIRLFPVWPADRPASFHRLRAKGAFLVSSELREGRVTHVLLTSERGGEARVLDPWGGGCAVVTPEGKPVPHRSEDGVLAFETSAGRTYRLIQLPERD
jgi:hypothetical protein